LLTRAEAGVGFRGRGEPGAAAVYHGRGGVKAINRDKSTVRIGHEKIEGYMETLTMDYRVADLSLLNSIEVGEGADFTLEEAAGVASITALKGGGRQGE
jgi:Cu/Ag efflux protein CusF